MRDDWISPKANARQAIWDCINEIEELPRFSGQTQIIRSLRKVLSLTVWSK